uniref:Secreted protein n=1 Tax=Panagrellus redivivus TaxID=6233 RepID=A0A7E4ZZ81_PANRE
MILTFTARGRDHLLLIGDKKLPQGAGSETESREREFTNKNDKFGRDVKRGKQKPKKEAKPLALCLVCCVAASGGSKLAAHQSYSLLTVKARLPSKACTKKAFSQLPPAMLHLFRPLLFPNMNNLSTDSLQIVFR